MPPKCTCDDPDEDDGVEWVCEGSVCDGACWYSDGTVRYGFARVPFQMRLFNACLLGHWSDI
jgi:hypothetical protein